MTNPSTNPQLSITLRTDWLAGFLRADQIRTDTLTQLAAAWADPDTRDTITTALDTLADIVQNPHPAEGHLDAAIEDIETSAGMDTAHIPIDRNTAGRLAWEATGTHTILSRFNPDGTTRIPRQPEGEAM